MPKQRTQPSSMTPQEYAQTLTERFNSMRKVVGDQRLRQIFSGAKDSTPKWLDAKTKAEVEEASHVRMEAKRTAMETLANSSKMAGYDTNHDTSDLPVTVRPV